MPAGGRPRAADAALLGERIVAAASAMFLRDGYAATSIEAIAAAAGVSKRTFYARFDSKAAVFLEVVRALVDQWRVGFDERLHRAETLEDGLLTAARGILDVALMPAAMALYGLITAEAMRLPEVADALRQSGVDAGVVQVADLLLAHVPGLPAEAARFAAEQFQGMIVAGPRRRAMGLGLPLDAAARERWCRDSVALLLRGVGGLADPMGGSDGG